MAEILLIKQPLRLRPGVLGAAKRLRSANLMWDRIVAEQHRGDAGPLRPTPTQSGTVGG